MHSICSQCGEEFKNDKPPMDVVFSGDGIFFFCSRECRDVVYHPIPSPVEESNEKPSYHPKRQSFVRKIARKFILAFR
jgi:hypothetical protein